ncbi:hypothetical protein BOX15_Mlig027855g1, partial [Macrostomum lignano]
RQWKRLKQSKQEMDGGGAYGAGKAQGFGYNFNPIEFVKRPTSILRLLSWFFAIIVFGCISSGAYVENICIMMGQKNACGFGVFTGVVAFLGCMVFLLGDILFEKLSSVQHRRLLVIADMGFSAAWTFLYFVAFCYMANKWSNTSSLWLKTIGVQPWQRSNVRASIAFAFFSVASMAGLTYFAFLKYRQGAEGAFDTADQIENQIGSGQQQQQQQQEQQQQQPPFAHGGDFQQQQQQQQHYGGDLSAGSQYQQGGY